MSNSPLPFNGSEIKVTPSSSTALKQLDFKPEENVLNSFDQVTYHIKFSVLSDIPGVDREIVIAESGKTDLNITNCTIDSVVGPELRTQNMSATSIKLDLTEFYGYGLMNRLVEASTILGIRNYSKTPFKLEVKFVGYDSVTGKPLGNVLGSQVWGWKVIITNITTTTDIRGCSHVIDLIPISDVAGTDDYFRIPESFGVDGRTCGDLLHDLFGKLNNDLKEKYGGIDMISYHVESAPYPPSAQSPVKTPLDLEVTNDSVFDSIRRRAQGSTNTGLSISELVDSLISNSETGVTLANSVGVKGTGTPNEPNKNHAVLVRIEKKVEYGNYIDLYEDYEKKITYCLTPYSTIRPITNFNDYANVFDPERTTNRLQFVNSEIGIKKQYDYIFTGKNTEVLRFDISMAFSYYVSVDLMLGARKFYAITHGQAFNQDAADRATASEYQANIEKLKDLTRRKNAALQSANPGSFTSEDQKTLDSLQKSVDQNRERVQAAAKASEERDKERIKKSTIDLNKRSKTTYIDNEDYRNAISHTPIMPITMRQKVNVSGMVDGIVEGGPDPRRSIYAAILDQVYGTDANLATINIDIKGDPYWLGPPGYRDLYDNGFSPIPTQTISSMRNIKDSNTSKGTESYANYSIGENVMVVKYNVPNGIDENTGRPLLETSNSYSGFYAVNTVTHKFTNGRFEQTLQAVRVPGADLTKVLKNRQISSSTSPDNFGNFSSGIVANYKPIDTNRLKKLNIDDREGMV